MSDRTLHYFDDKDYFYYRGIEEDIGIQPRYNSTGLIIDGDEYIGLFYMGGTSDDIPTELSFLVEVWSIYKRLNIQKILEKFNNAQSALNAFCDELDFYENTVEEEKIDMILNEIADTMQLIHRLQFRIRELSGRNKIVGE